MLKVILKFDYHSDILFIPDGYINNLNEVYLNFFEWISERPQNYISKENMCGLSYDEKDFLEYINQEILVGVNEKAYLVKKDTNVNTIESVLKF